MDKLQDIIDFELPLGQLMMLCHVLKERGEFFDYEVAVEDETDFRRISTLHHALVPKSCT